MKKTISATFDSADSAELALIHLNRSDIPLLSMHTSSLESISAKPDIFNLAPIYASRGIDNTNLSILPIMIPAAPLSPTRQRLIRDVISNDVRLSVEVPEGFSNRTRKTLVSCHGHDLREE